MDRGLFKGVAVRYVAAIVAVATAAILTRMLASFGASSISPLFFAAVLIVAWYGGLGAALAATVLSGMATAYLVVPRVGSFEGSRDLILRVLVFTVVAVLMSSLNVATRRAALASRAAADASRRAREAAESAAAAKDRFIAMVSHELRTPLSPVVMAMGWIREDPSVTSALRSDLQMIDRNVQLELRLIDDLVDLMRSSRGKLNLKLESIDLHDSLSSAVRLCEPDICEKQIDLTTDYLAENCRIRGDAVRIQQVFWNLIRNAVKFTPSRGRIRIRSSNGPDGSITVDIADSGIGISPEKLTAIFEAFEQGGPDVTARFGGLGLGLAICQALTEAHGGTIVAASEGCGRGATFTVALPGDTAPLESVEGGTSPEQSLRHCTAQCGCD